MDISQYVLLGAVIVGVTELINRARGRDWWVVTSIVTAAVIGGLFGHFHYYPDLDTVEGIAAGFGAAGALKGISAVGQKSVPKPSDVIVRDGQ